MSVQGLQYAACAFGCWLAASAHLAVDLLVFSSLLMSIPAALLRGCTVRSAFAFACFDVHVLPELAALLMLAACTELGVISKALLPVSACNICSRPCPNLPCRDKTAERYSLLRKLTITEPDSRTLELNFTVSDKEGAPRIPDHTVKASRRSWRLERISITPCSATEIKVLRALPTCRCT